jgi:uncharacterized protein YprB with RNaseH-like and TPR domain
VNDNISVVIFDLETTGLFGKNGDILLTSTFMDLNHKHILCKVCEKKHPKTFAVKNDTTPDSDQTVAVQISDILREYDRVVSWNGHGFDMGFLNDRLRVHRERPLLHRGSFDLKEYCKKTFPYLDGRQDSYAKALDIGHQKTPLDLAQNQKLGRGEGEPEDWADLLYHNDEDVKGLWELYNEFIIREAS